MLFLKNPGRYADKPDFLQIASNILSQEINEQKLLDRMKMNAVADVALNAFDVKIKLFGGLEIITEQGRMNEAEIKSPLGCKVLVILLMNRNRGMSAREISEKIWSDKEYENPTGNLRSLVYRMRTAFHLISEKDLIVTSPNGYRINEKLEIRIDFDRFTELCMAKGKDAKARIEQLSEAIRLYQGKFFPSGEGEHWLIPYVTKCHLMYLEAFSELMDLLEENRDFRAIHEFSMLSLRVEPDSPLIIYWLIIALRKHGAADMAKQHLEAAKYRLLADEYRELEERLIGR